MMNSKRSIVQLLVAGCCAAAVSVAHAASGPPAPAPTAKARHPSATAAATDLRVLRRPRDASRDALPARLRRGELLAGAAIDLSASRQVAAADGERAWIAPSLDGASVCAVRHGAVACPSALLLETTGLSPGINGRADEPFHVWGIAGDDVSSIVLVEADSTRVPVSVTDNFFDVETDDWPRSLTWTGPSGGESFTFPPYSP